MVNSTQILTMQTPVQQQPTPLHSFFENIMDKKVQNVALNIFERIVDFLCTYLYPSYRQRLDFLMKGMNVNQTAQGQQVTQKVIHFMDGAPLYDRTSSQRVEIKREKLFDLIKKVHFEGEDEIYVDGKPVHFAPIPNGMVLFGTRYGTKEVFVMDVAECPEIVIIYEREVSGNLKAWCVDTTKPTQKITTGGQLTIGQMDIFIAQQITSQVAPPPLVVPII